MLDMCSVWVWCVSLFVVVCVVVCSCVLCSVLVVVCGCVWLCVVVVCRTHSQDHGKHTHIDVHVGVTLFAL